MVPCAICEEQVVSQANDHDELCETCRGLMRWLCAYFVHESRNLSTVTPATTFSNLGAESLCYMNWVFEAEDKLGVTIPDADAQQMTNVHLFLS